jgi:hypothetical protein
MNSLIAYFQRCQEMRYIWGTDAYWALLSLFFTHSLWPTYLPISVYLCSCNENLWYIEFSLSNFQTIPSIFTSTLQTNIAYCVVFVIYGRMKLVALIHCTRYRLLYMLFLMYLGVLLKYVKINNKAYNYPWSKIKICINIH